MASQSIKRQRKRKRVDQDGDPEFQVAPMVDVLLVLMLFFMSITSTELMKKDPNLQLAEAKHGKKPDPRQKHAVTVNIGWDHAKSVALFSMDGISFPTADSLSGILGTRVKQDPQAYVLIRADKDVEYSNVSDLMNACATAGIGTVTFAVISGGAKKAPGADASTPAPN